MTLPNKRELQIIQAASLVDVPEHIMRESGIEDLLQAMFAEQDAVQSSEQRLGSLRQKKKEGNVLSNWWNGLDNKVQNAQLDLNQSIGRLTQTTSQLLIFNTAVSKVLNGQQRTLQEQQHSLKSQTDTLEEQNQKILEQQRVLEKQQTEINKVNQGLLDATGITQDQALKLVGCVTLVTEAEKKIDVANQEMRFALEQHLHDSIVQCIDRLNAGFAEQDHRHAELERHITDVFSTQSQHVQEDLDGFAKNNTEFKASIEKQLLAHIQIVLEKTAAQDASAQQLHETISAKLTKLQQDIVSVVEKKDLAIRETVQTTELKHGAVLDDLTQVLNAQRESLKSAETQLKFLQVERHKSNSRNRLALAGMICVLLAFIGWQTAQYFALI